MMDDLALIHGLADETLSAEDRARAVELIRTNPKMAHEFQWAQESRRLLGKNCPPIENPEGWSACQRRLDDLEKTKTVEKFVGKYAWGLCCIFFVGILAAGFTTRLRGPQAISQTQIASILDPFAASNAEVKASIPTNRIDLSQFEVTSHQSGRIQNLPVDRLVLRDQVGLGGLALYVIQGVGSIEGINQPTGTPGFLKGRLNGTNCVSWSVANYTCLLVGEREPNELVGLARAMTK
ncbi:hypothetical protein QPK87_19255 [Kamptonema cortianum]|nr:hypothetical protein [Geitlerinema splendidum]MDK3158694.1 hypothetical protein [Kamptonema cortianum]